MTVSSQTNNATFVGNGVTTVFPLPFRFFASGDVAAYFIDSTTGASTPMVLGTDYTLAGAGEPEVNGNAVSVLTTTAPLATGRGLYVERIMQEVQNTDIVNQGEFFASTHEDVFDRLTMLIQQANANSNGAIRVAIGDPEPQRLAPAARRANLLLGFDELGQPITVAPISGSATDLAINLANNTDPAKGAGMVGYKGGTVSSMLDSLPAILSQRGGVAESDNSSALQTLLNTYSGTGIPVIIDIPSIIRNVTIPDYSTIIQRADIRIDSADAFIIDSARDITLKGGRASGYSVTRQGTGKLVSIDGVSSYANKNISVRGWDCSGGSGNFIQWKRVERFYVEDNVLHDFTNGVGVYTTSSATDVDANSASIYIRDNSAFNITGTATCHAISINSWRHVFGVIITGNRVSNIRNNGIEVWANYVLVDENDVLDTRIAYSYGQCHFLNHGMTNIARMSYLDASTGSTAQGGIGIELGGCVRFTVCAGIIDGYRVGISFTQSVIGTPPDTIWHDPTAATYGAAGILAAPEFLRIKTLSGVSGLSGSYYGAITGGLITNALNHFISIAGDFFYNDTICVTGVRMSHMAKFAAATSTAASAVYVNGTTADIDNCTISDVGDGRYGVNADQGHVRLGRNTFERVAGQVLRNVGAGSSITTGSVQKLVNCPTASGPGFAEPSQGSWQAGDVVYNQIPVAGGTIGRVCTTPGTQSSMLTTTAETTSGSPSVVFRRTAADPNSIIKIGTWVTIAGVSGRFSVLDIAPGVFAGGTWSASATLSANPDATVIGASVSYSAATFKSFGAISA